MNVTDKDVSNRHQLLGQYITPKDVVQFCLDRTDIHAKLIIEPSCGTGVFLNPIRAKFPDAKIRGWEVDPKLLDQYVGDEPIFVRDFYDVEDVFLEPVHFIGNPPYRSPAYSLQYNKSYVTKLRERYHVKGVREEAVLFLLKTVDLIKSSGVEGWISYILPKAIFKNNSRVFTAFLKFLRSHLRLLSVWDLGNEFEGVARDLVYAQFSTQRHIDYFLLNGIWTHVNDFYGVESDIIPFQRIFKKTYLGSVPCESIFLSCKHEPLLPFRGRLAMLFGSEVTKDNVIELLSYQGKPHLKALQKKDPEKIQVVLKYIRQTKELPGFDLELFRDLDNYKPIRHRDEDRWYFRHEFLKKAPFVYQINPNPCPSFYFPGNPSSSSGDYFGFCGYDVNRNSGPGANRTVPMDHVEANLTEGFKKYWRKHTDLPFEKVFDYLLYIKDSRWYREFKAQNQRFYFGVPQKFDKSFLKEVSNGIEATKGNEEKEEAC